MSRPKGSKNKSTLAKLAVSAPFVTGELQIIATGTTVPIEDTQAESEYHATLCKQDETLDGFIAEIDATFSTVKPELKAKQSRKIASRLANLMSEIHNSIAGTINAYRIAESRSNNKINYVLDNPTENYHRLLIGY